MYWVQHTFAWLSISAAVMGSISCEDPVPTLPTPTSPCPQFVNGTVTIRAGGVNRRVLLYLNAAATQTTDGPLFIFFHGTFSPASQAAAGLDIAKITNMGGIVASPEELYASGQTFPWIQSNDDLPLLDEIVACAKSTVGIDARRIHVSGLSAGALYTTAVSAQRSSYIASVATYSGGGTVPSYEDPTNKYPALILYGGPNDQVIINFQQASTDWYNQLIGDGHWAALCNHGLGHTIPPGGPAAVTQFLLDHPFRVQPEPYLASRPSVFPSYCTYPTQ